MGALRGGAEAGVQEEAGSVRGAGTSGTGPGHAGLGTLVRTLSLGPERAVIIVGLCGMLGKDRIIYLLSTYLFPTMVVASSLY